MAAQPGEEVVATLFADVHYFYGPPTDNPPHHRFDKGSYVYLYENRSQRRARIEIANHAGTPDQDAFDGYLDTVRVEYSYQQPSLVTLTVDGVRNAQRRSPTPQDSEEWRLPTFDPHNQKKYLYRLHTIDIYFWETEDAQQFVNGTKNVLLANQIAILHEPAPQETHAEAMSPIVQKLENVAVSDPSYQQGQTKNSQPSAPSFPGPPTAPVTRAEEPAAFTPMAYNPAAPPAPETIRHREKTPPPEDGAANPLAAAAVSDQGQQYTPGIQPPMANVPSAIGSLHQNYFPGPPQPVGQYGPGSVPSPPQKQVSPAYQQSQYQQQGSFVPQYAQQPAPYATYPGSAGFQPPMQSPSFAPPPQVTQAMHSPPIAPTSTYPAYTPTQPQQVPSVNDYSIHQQLYQPTEAEKAHKNKPAKQPPTGKFEENAQKLEKGVTGFLKKIEKKYG